MLETSYERNMRFFSIMRPQEFDREFFPDRHGKSSDDGTDNTNATDNQWINNPFQAMLGSIATSAKPRINAETIVTS